MSFRIGKRLVVGAKGFEPSTSCTPCKHANRTALRPERTELYMPHYDCASQVPISPLFQKYIKKESSFIIEFYTPNTRKNSQMTAETVQVVIHRSDEDQKVTLNLNDLDGGNTQLCAW